MEKDIQARLFNALLLDGPMTQALYEWELEEHVGYWRKGMLWDKDDFLIVVTEHTGDVAMLLIDKKGQLFINEEGRKHLRRKWKSPGVYANNMLLFIPQMAQQLHGGEIWVTGVKIMPGLRFKPNNRSVRLP